MRSRVATLPARLTGEKASPYLKLIIQIVEQCKSSSSETVIALNGIYALECLEEVAQEALPKLNEWSRDKNHQVRIQALRALKAVKEAIEVEKSKKTGP